MKQGLVLEGGAMRGLFSAGVMDVMMENGIEFDGAVGVSAGAAFGCNYKSRQPGRAIRYNMQFAKDKRYCSVESLVRTGDLFNAEFAYHTVPLTLDVFDSETFVNNPMEFYVVCTDVERGTAVYHCMDSGGNEAFDWIRASASMPVVSRMVELDGMKLLDGGVTDSIPLAFLERMGYGRNVVILTQPAGYVKKMNPLMPIMHWSLRKYPCMVKAMRTRHLMYNEQLGHVNEQERKGNAFVIRPDRPLDIGHISHNPDEMKAVYETGRRKGVEVMGRLKAFCRKI